MRVNRYSYQAHDQDGRLIDEGSIDAMTSRRAWARAIEAAFDAIPKGTGSTVQAMEVWRVKRASESHG